MESIVHYRTPVCVVRLFFWTLDPPPFSLRIFEERILASYDLRRYTFTYQVIIDEKAIPHSHPVLTLHTRHLGSDEQLLST